MCKKLNKCKYGDINYFLEDVQSYRDFASEDEAYNWGEKYYSDWAKKYVETVELSSSIMNAKGGIEYDPIRCYAGNTYQNINGLLRHGSPNDLSTKLTLHALLLALIYAPRIPENIICYRLVCDDFINNELIGTNKRKRMACVEKEFMSTTLVMDAVKGLENQHKNLLKIYVPKGSVGVYTEILEEARRDEYELLFPPNRQLGLLKYPYNDRSTGYKIFECKLINWESCFWEQHLQIGANQ